MNHSQMQKEEQATFFRDNGFLVCKDVFGKEEIAHLQDELVDLARGKYPTACLPTVEDGMSDADVLQNILCIHQPHGISPAVTEYAKNDKITAVLSQVVGAHLPQGWWDGSVKLAQSMFFAKGPGKPGQSWHQDEIYIPTRDRSLCGVWIAIDDAVVDNGCLWVAPGAHRSGELFQTREHDNPEWHFGEECFGFDMESAVPVEVPAGSVVFFNGYLPHCSLRNKSDGYRRALVFHYSSAQSLLPWGLALKEHGQQNDDSIPIGSIDDRSIIPVSGTDPYAWKGTTNDFEVWLRPEDSPVAEGAQI